MRFNRQHVADSMRPRVDAGRTPGWPSKSVRNPFQGVARQMALSGGRSRVHKLAWTAMSAPRVSANRMPSDRRAPRARGLECLIDAWRKTRHVASAARLSESDRLWRYRFDRIECAIIEPHRGEPRTGHRARRESWRAQRSNLTARSVPNQCFARAPSTALRWFSISGVVLAEISEQIEASRRSTHGSPQPPDRIAEAADVSPVSTARREAAPS